MTPLAAAIGEAFEQACLAELEAPKPGNVHVFAAGHGMTAQDFVLSARAAASGVAGNGARLGGRILRAVEATLAAVGQNSNLGIVLLCAPLAMAAERGGSDLRASLREVLGETNLADAVLTHEAIRLAAPGGLGKAARHDVRDTPNVSLLEAMREAASRDRIAYQYDTAFRDIFETGMPVLRSFLDREDGAKAATLAVYLTFLATFADTHIARKHGAATADAVLPIARGFLERLRAGATLSALEPELLAWDAALKTAGVNPGTSADLTVATLFALRLERILRAVGNSG